MGFVVVPPAPGEPAVVYLMQLPAGEPTALKGTAALIWVLASEGEGDVPGALAELMRLPLADVAGSVGDYLDHLVRDGWLKSL